MADNNINANESMLKVAQININSLVSVKKRTEFELFLKEYKPQIVLISETHLSSKHRVNFNGYKMYREDRVNGSGGGTAICICDDIDCEFIPKPKDIESLESCSVKVNLENNRQIVFSAIYRRPIIKIKCDDLSRLLKINKESDFMIAGDFNAHNPLWGSDKVCTNGRLINEWFDENKNTFKAIIKSPKNPTCSSNKKGTFIDFVIISENLRIANSDINGKIPSAEIFSDHSVIFTNICCDKIKKCEPMKIKNFKKTNWKKFNEFIDKRISEINIPIHSNIDGKAIDEISENIENIFKEAIKRFVPEIEVHSSNIELSSKSLALIQEKKRLMRKKFRNRNNEHSVTIKSQIKLINQLLLQSISKDYSIWWKQRITKIKPDNNLFKNIKKISKYKSQNAMPHTLSNSDSSETYISNEQKCDAFAKARQLTASNISAIEDEVKNINQLYEQCEPIVNFTHDMPADFKENPSNQMNINDNLRNKFIDSREIRQIIKSRNNKKSSGCDNMPNYALKKLSALTIYWLAVFLNHVTNMQHIPENWKFALITPIPKQGKNINIVENWRSISQLPTLSKCYEKFLDTKIRDFCNAMNLLDPYQFGFQPGNSTVHAIAKIINDISRGLNEKKPTLAVLIDLQAAFDVIWHDGLIYKLHKFKFDPFIIRLVKNFLKNRKFAVTINKKMSNIKNIVAGTPKAV